ncbi:MAG: homoserine/threonine efflux transporter [Pasteurellaceae bacterium]|nr:homoserine/threonine efflux transporter [Pasteurellaceae bacterium]
MFNLMLIHFIGLLTPGPDFFYIIRMSARSSRRNAICAVIGICLGVAVWAGLSILGLAILFQTFPILHALIMLLGGSYLFYLGIIMLKVHENIHFDPDAEKQINQNSSIKQEIMKGLFVNLSNAKAILYFASVMSLVLVNLSSLWQMWLAFGLIFIETLLYFYTLSVLFSRPVAKRFYSQYSRYIDNGAGAIFALFGLYLIYSSVIEEMSQFS